MHHGLLKGGGFGAAGFESCQFGVHIEQHRGYGSLFLAITGTSYRQLTELGLRDYISDPTAFAGFCSKIKEVLCFENIGTKTQVPVFY